MLSPDLIIDLKNCVICGSIFESTDGRRVTCLNPRCQSKRHSDNIRRIRETRGHRNRYRYEYLDSITCSWCGIRTKRKRWDQTTCGSLCSKKFRGVTDNYIRNTLKIEAIKRDKEREGSNYKRLKRVEVATGEVKIMPEGWRREYC